MSDPQVKLETSYGEIIIELNTEKAPKTVENFLSYVDEGFYDDLIFHRVIDGFMVQGGGMDKDMNEKKGERAALENEADNGLKNTNGTLAMARTNDPHSATAQFFINITDNAFLDHTAKTNQGWGYAVFGKVTEGMDVVDKIKKVATGTTGHHQDVPKDPVFITKASRIAEDE